MAVIIPVCRAVGRTEGTCKVTVQGLAWSDGGAFADGTAVGAAGEAGVE